MDYFDTQITAYTEEAREIVDALAEELDKAQSGNFVTRGELEDMANQISDIGVWTPILTDNTSTGGNPSYEIQEGVYSRTGNTVLCTARIRLNSSAHGLTGSVRIIGFPYANSSLAHAPGVISVVSNAGTPAPLTGYINKSSTSFYLGYTDPSSGNWLSLNAATVGALSLMISVTYRVYSTYNLI